MARAPRAVLAVLLIVGLAAVCGIAVSAIGAAPAPTAVVLLVVREDGIWQQPVGRPRVGVLRSCEGSERC